MPLVLQTSLEATLRHEPLAAVPVLFAAGLATSLTPCVYPMIPITAGILGGAGAAGVSRGRTAGLTAAYVVGLALVYALLGLLAGLTGSLFGSIASSPWAYFLVGNLLLVLGLALLDVFTVNAPQKVAVWAGRLGAGSAGGAFTMGAASGLVAAPCGAPAFAAVLTFVAAPFSDSCTCSCSRSGSPRCWWPWASRAACSRPCPPLAAGPSGSSAAEECCSC